MNKIEIRQIYYDDTSFSQLQEPFIPLNNVEGDKSWFEFWPMINFLAQTELEENIFYGFFRLGRFKNIIAKQKFRHHDSAAK